MDSLLQYTYAIDHGESAMLTETLKATAELAQTTYKAGYQDGYRKGFKDAIAEARAIVDSTFRRDQVPEVKPLVRE